MLRIIYDNTAPVSQQVQSLIGIENFGTLIYRRRTLLNWLQASAEAAGIEPPIELNSPSARLEIERRLRNGEWADDLFLFCPAQVVSSKGFDALTLFLRQASHSPISMALPATDGPEWSGWLLLSAPLARDYLRKLSEGDLTGFFDQNAGSIIRVEDRMALLDLDEEATLLKFLAGAFDVRFFNAIEQDEYTIRKRSTDKAKLEREYRFFELIPPEMQMFFIRPFDFATAEGSASYRMERLHVPDMALQWLHGALSEVEFGRFLDRVFHFLRIRAEREADAAEVEAQFQLLFVDKVRDRLEQLVALPSFAELKALLEPVCGSVDLLARRYFDMLEASRARFPRDRLVVGHGDLCFSNILYGKSTQLMKLIDPRGASSEADIYTHPYYDLAKLSHSVLGNYDRINQDMFDIQVGEDLKLRLVFDRAAPDWAERMFTQRIDQSGYDLRLVRLCEASLFISMLPLHMDRPRKVLGFAVNAVNILDQLERGRQR